MYGTMTELEMQRGNSLLTPHFSFLQDNESSLDFLTGKTDLNQSVYFTMWDKKERDIFIFQNEVIRDISIFKGQ